MTLGFSRLHIGVLTANHPARAFYEALGGREVRQRTFDEDGFPLSGTVYVWPDLTDLVTGSRPVAERDPDVTAEDERRRGELASRAAALEAELGRP